MHVDKNIDLIIVARFISQISLLDSCFEIHIECVI